MSLSEKMMEMIISGHDGQTRRDGKTPYVSHPIAVRDLGMTALESYFQINLGISELIHPISKKLYNVINNSYANIIFPPSKISPDEFKEIFQIVLLGHDLIEDALKKGFTLDFILKELRKNDSNHSDTFFNIIGYALLSVTHDDENESYLNYILRAKSNPIGHLVKIFDITHNISTRTGSNTAADKSKDKIAIDKYKLAEYILLN